MKINITEIANRAGVSVATVSRALNNKGPIRPATKQKILQIAAEYNYKPNSSARSLSRQRTDTIGVILPELADEFFMDILRGVDEEAHSTGNYVMVSSSHSQRNMVETMLEFMSSGRVDGVILMAPLLHDELIEMISKSSRPVILLNNYDSIPNAACININNYQGAFVMTEHLIRLGHKRIALIKGPEGNGDVVERVRGFNDAMENSAIEIDNQNIISGDFSIKSGYHGLMRLMSSNNKPDAVFALNDMMAVGCYEAAKSLAIKIPDDIAIAGFDDIYLTRFLSPRLTTVHTPIKELGQQAVSYLIKMIEGEAAPKKEYCGEITASLIIGGSCGSKNVTNQTIF